MCDREPVVMRLVGIAETIQTCSGVNKNALRTWELQGHGVPAAPG